MKKFIKLFAYFFTFIFLFPVKTFGMVIIHPPSCNDYPSYSVTVGNTVNFRGSVPEYRNGFLIIRLKFNSTSDNRDFNFNAMLLRDSDCAYMDSVYSKVVSVPQGVSDISIRFSSDSLFQIYDDSTNTPLECADCNINFIPSDVPPYKVQLFITNGFNNNYLRSSPFKVEDPNFQPSKTPVLLIPGSLATDIYKGDDKLWLDINKLVLTNNDRFMDPLAFDTNGVPIDNSLSLGSVLDKPNEKFDYSQALINDFKSQNYTESSDLQLFAYDWRRDIKENSDGPLKQKIDELVAASSNGKIDVIAHSQGGLLIKRLLFDYPEYKNKIEKLIFVGTPNLGSPKSFKVLSEGDQFGIKYMKVLGLDPEEIKRISQNMPSVYEMLPTAEYFNHYSGYWGELDRHLFSPNEEIIYDYNTTKQKLKEAGYNSSLLDKNDAFHSFDYDQFDFTNSGIEAYNIMGCQTPTYGGVIKRSFEQDRVIWLPGDETVPIKSAANFVNVQNSYSFDASHATMLTNEGIRHKIVNLITGSNLSTPNLTSDVSDCHFDGTEVSSHSPVDLHIYDSQGNHVGPTANGGFDFNIPNVGYDTIGHENFAFLPTGSQYTVKLVATGSGSFNFDSSQVKDGVITNMAYYDHVMITASSTAQVDLITNNSQSIQLDINGDGSIDQTIQPSSILDSNQSQDLTPPISTSTITGLMGQEGFYRGEVGVSLSSIDPIVNNNPDQTSGVLNIRYNLDNQGYQIYNASTPIRATAQGQHTITFFSTDNAGNNEPEQSIIFVIDKTPPELVMQFNPNTKDLEFTATDTLPTIISATSTLTKKLKFHLPKITDMDNLITATDSAGNTTVLTFKDKDRKRNLKADIKSLSYNSINQDISKLQLHFDWQFDKKGNLLLLTQNIQAKKDFNISAIYALNKTVILGKDQNGKIRSTLPGLALLRVITNKGDLGWGY